MQDAVVKAYEEAQNGKLWYLRSDIKEFFTKIDRLAVINAVSRLVSDEKFLALVQSALTTELDNLEQLGQKAEIFPIYEIGVAQGCCLSPLSGNILLHDFDKEMNSRGIVCLRYIDDFLLLGSKKDHVQKAFQKAQEILRSMNLTAYDPDTDPAKAELGKTEEGFEFLGCRITSDAITPSAKSTKSLLVKVERELTRSYHMMQTPQQLRTHRLSLTDTLKSISNIIEGWGNQYSFCNTSGLFGPLDNEIDGMISRYLSRYSTRKEKFGSTTTDRRRLLGVHPLVDCYMNPRVPHSEN